MTACKFAALVKDTEPGGPAVRDAPRQDGREVGRLPANRSRYVSGVELAEIQVMEFGVKDGWFLIEGAAYSEPHEWQLYAGRGLGRGQIRHDESVSRYL